jgi:O-antigen/teichoic acid export membrane protein
VSFLNGEQAFVILCAGQVVNVLFGSVGTLLIMSGNQRSTVLSLLAGTIFNVLGSVLLTPKYGIVGTAIAAAGSLAIWNLLMYFFVIEKTKIRPTIFEAF